MILSEKVSSLCCLLHSKWSRIIYLMMIAMILTMISLYFSIQGALTPHEPEPFLTGIASWYDYSLPFDGGDNRSRSHDTCALRIYERYQTFKVCSDLTWKCIECYHNDYGPSRTDRVIDLSSHAFMELWVPLSRGLTPVSIYSLS